LRAKLLAPSIHIMGHHRMVIFVPCQFSAN
jgi:hypothetical protein